MGIRDMACCNGCQWAWSIILPSQELPCDQVIAWSPTISVVNIVGSWLTILTSRIHVTQLVAVHMVYLAIIHFSKLKERNYLFENSSHIQAWIRQPTRRFQDPGLESTMKCSIFVCGRIVLLHTSLSSLSADSLRVSIGSPNYWFVVVGSCWISLQYPLRNEPWRRARGQA